MLSNENIKINYISQKVCLDSIIALNAVVRYTKNKELREECVKTIKSLYEKEILPTLDALCQHPK